LEYRSPGQTYIEPFVGGGWVLQEVKGTRYASDINPYLIAMYKALQQGWVPPDYVSEEEYQKAKKGECSDALRGFIGFGCSFGGKWFGGYARSHKTRREAPEEYSKDYRSKYATHAKNSVLKMLPRIKDTIFYAQDYRFWTPLGSIVYCDPPYEGFTPYDYSPKFDYPMFWETMRTWSMDNTVLISSYSAPDDFESIWQKETRTDLKSKDGSGIPRLEKVFKFKRRRG